MFYVTLALTSSKLEPVRKSVYKSSHLFGYLNSPMSTGTRGSHDVRRSHLYFATLTVLSPS